MSDISVSVSETPELVSITVIEGSGSAATWGGIVGLIVNQADLQAELDGKQNIDNIASKSADYTIVNESIIICTNTSAINITLPDAATVLNKRIMIIQQNTGSVTVLCAGTDTLNGVSSLLLNNRYSVLELLSTSYGWIII